MNKESGVTLVETLAALAILSLATVSISAIVSNHMRYWDYTSESLQSHESVADLVNTVADYKALPTKQALNLDQAPVLTLENETELVLATPKAERGADCVFDLVGRRCR